MMFRRKAIAFIERRAAASANEETEETCEQ